MANPHIKIHLVTGGREGERLRDCYFEEIDSSKEFNFYDREGQPIQTDPSPIRSSDKFEFQYEELQWKVHKFTISEEHLHAHGHWKAKAGDSSDDPESGTFQAQSGGHVSSEVGVGASAKA
jgi:hypothetical protein